MDASNHARGTNRCRDRDIPVDRRSRLASTVEPAQNQNCVCCVCVSCFRVFDPPFSTSTAPRLRHARPDLCVWLCVTAAPVLEAGRGAQLSKRGNGLLAACTRRKSGERGQVGSVGFHLQEHKLEKMEAQEDRWRDDSIPWNWPITALFCFQSGQEKERDPPLTSQAPVRPRQMSCSLEASPPQPHFVPCKQFMRHASSPLQRCNSGVFAALKRRRPGQHPGIRDIDGENKEGTSRLVALQRQVGPFCVRSA